MSPRAFRQVSRPVLPSTSTLEMRITTATSRASASGIGPPITQHPSIPIRQTSPSRLQSRNRSFRHKACNTITALIAVLVVAGLASLFAAFYLYASAPRTSLVFPSGHHSGENEQSALPETSVAVTAFSSIAPAVTTTVPLDRYLAYLPHSGFHNQRIALENALVLAHMLNRTLLLPPVRLGDPLSYAPFDELYEVSALTNGWRKKHCSNRLLVGYKAHPECATYTQISWNWLVDLSSLGEDQQTLEGWNFTDAWLQGELDIYEDDIFYLKDSTRNEYSFQDFPTLDPPSRKFFQSINITTLAQQPERLIQMGTLFGSSRLHLRSSVNYSLRRRVREAMTLTNPVLARAAESIRDALGGAYFGVHLRLGDGVFEWNAPENVRTAWWKLLHLALELSLEDILALERDAFPNEDAADPPVLKEDLPAMRAPHPPLPVFPAEATPRGISCRSPLHTSPGLAALNAPLFISTDARSPASNPVLKRFTRTFPCTFFLSDFPEQAAPLRALRSPVDGVPLAAFFMPFLDAMVVGQAWQVVGTEQSTFSAFVTDILWRRYHGFKIVQRG
ncbi:hypothetical protein C2E23DRAFT_801496 [Lenzites betulinus]|nr:hypothetical protein C2E23DRAFT_801496 [Lenzites betulinus]